MAVSVFFRTPESSHVACVRPPPKPARSDSSGIQSVALPSSVGTFRDASGWKSPPGRAIDTSTRASRPRS